MQSPRTVPALLIASAALAALVGCSTGADAAVPAGGTPAAAPARSAASAHLVTAPTAPPSSTAAPAPAAASAPSKPAAAPVADDDARTRPAVLAIPEIGLAGLRVLPYEGTTDDWPGTRIQNQGLGASPYGPRGGVAPGEVGNYLVTAHRLSAGGPLRDLPALDPGDSVFVTAGGVVHEYRITETRKTSFRSAASLAEQRAAVPGRPGVEPVKPMITISTCATPEDNAEGNHWRDDRGNPEHRIDKIGVLVSSRPR
ncbi:class E sortase [Streptomyces sp. NPDC086023]|uniref:class E sortase n=1 Tax=Streptomyces sp. NPDC086023 TaxID=3365746 RepID=UPI0037D44FE7